MKKENVLDTLRVLGFTTQEIEDFGYKFDFEGISLLYTEDDEEAKCLTLSAPNICDFSEDNRERILTTIAATCCKLKYVQPFIMFDSQVWLAYQHFIGDNELTPELLEHMIRVLAYSTAAFHSLLSEEDPL